MSNIERDAWKVNANKLANDAWDTMVNRTDVWGGCYSKHTGGTVTRPPTNKRGTTFLTKKVILAHFQNAEDRTKLIGLHSTSQSNDSKWFGLDIDKHDKQPGDPTANERAAKAWYQILKQQGLHPLLFDSNGKGGFHILTKLDTPAPTADVFHFAQQLIADYKQYGVISEPETFPKQAAVTEKNPCGNWLRLPGKHPKSKHYTKAWDGIRWLAGQACIDLILNNPRSDSKLIPTAPPTITAQVPQAPAAIPFTRAVALETAHQRIKEIGPKPDGERNKTAYSLGCEFVHDLELDESTALDYLMMWDKDNLPPLGVEKVASVLKNAISYGSREKGSSVKAQCRQLVLNAKLNQLKVFNPNSIKQALLTGKDSTDVLVDFLRTFKPIYKVGEKIFFGKTGSALSPKKCTSLTSALEVVRMLPEHSAQRNANGDIKPLTERNLAAAMFGDAGERLKNELTEEQSHLAGIGDEIENAIIGFLIRPQSFPSESGVPRIESYATWLNLLNETGIWTQCNKHSVYGLLNATGERRMAIVPQFLLNGVPKIQKVSKNIQQVSDLLQDAGLIVPPGSQQVWTDKRRVRVWELTPKLVNQACGELKTIDIKKGA